MVATEDWERSLAALVRFSESIIANPIAKSHEGLRKVLPKWFMRGSEDDQRSSMQWQAQDYIPSVLQFTGKDCKPHSDVRTKGDEREEGLALNRGLRGAYLSLIIC